GLAESAGRLEDLLFLVLGVLRVIEARRRRDVEGAGSVREEGKVEEGVGAGNEKDEEGGKEEEKDEEKEDEGGWEEGEDEEEEKEGGDENEEERQRQAELWDRSEKLLEAASEHAALLAARCCSLADRQAGSGGRDREMGAGGPVERRGQQQQQQQGLASFLCSEALSLMADIRTRLSQLYVLSHSHDRGLAHAHSATDAAAAPIPLLRPFKPHLPIAAAAAVPVVSALLLRCLLRLGGAVAEVWGETGGGKKGNWGSRGKSRGGRDGRGSEGSGKGGDGLGLEGEEDLCCGWVYAWDSDGSAAATGDAGSHTPVPPLASAAASAAAEVTLLSLLHHNMPFPLPSPLSDHNSSGQGRKREERGELVDSHGGERGGEQTEGGKEGEQVKEPFLDGGISRPVLFGDLCASICSNAAAALTGNATDLADVAGSNPENASATAAGSAGSSAQLLPAVAMAGAAAVVAHTMVHALSLEITLSLGVQSAGTQERLTSLVQGATRLSHLLKSHLAVLQQAANQGCGAPRFFLAMTDGATLFALTAEEDLARAAGGAFRLASEAARHTGRLELEASWEALGMDGSSKGGVIGSRGPPKARHLLFERHAAMKPLAHAKKVEAEWMWGGGDEDEEEGDEEEEKEVEEEGEGRRSENVEGRGIGKGETGRFSGRRIGSRFAGSKFGGTRRVNVELLIESVNIAAELAYHSHRVLTKCVGGVGSGWVGEVTEAALSAQIIDATGGFVSDLNMRGGAGVVRVSATSGVRAYGDVDMSAPIPVLSVFAVKLQTPAAAAVGESAAWAGGVRETGDGDGKVLRASEPTPPEGTAASAVETTVSATTTAPAAAAPAAASDGSASVGAAVDSTQNTPGKRSASADEASVAAPSPLLSSSSPYLPPSSSCHSAIRPSPHADVILPIPLFLSSSEEDRSSFGTDPTVEQEEEDEDEEWYQELLKNMRDVDLGFGKEERASEKEEERACEREETTVGEEEGAFGLRQKEAREAREARKEEGGETEEGREQQGADEVPLFGKEAGEGREGRVGREEVQREESGRREPSPCSTDSDAGTIASEATDAVPDLPFRLGKRFYNIDSMLNMREPASASGAGGAGGFGAGGAGGKLFSGYLDRRGRGRTLIDGAVVGASVGAAGAEGTAGAVGAGGAAGVVVGAVQTVDVGEKVSGRREGEGEGSGDLLQFDEVFRAKQAQRQCHAEAKAAVAAALDAQDDLADAEAALEEASKEVARLTACTDTENKGTSLEELVKGEGVAGNQAGVVVTIDGEDERGSTVSKGCEGRGEGNRESDGVDEGVTEGGSGEEGNAEGEEVGGVAAKAEEEGSGESTENVSLFSACSSALASLERAQVARNEAAARMRAQRHRAAAKVSELEAARSFYTTLLRAKEKRVA
ncbi:unnamed protein product, partial [Closterium sp. Naga37s-1]